MTGETVMNKLFTFAPVKYLRLPSELWARKGEVTGAWNQDSLSLSLFLWSNEDQVMSVYGHSSHNSFD